MMGFFVEIDLKYFLLYEVFFCLDYCLCNVCYVYWCSLDWSLKSRVY